MMITRPSLLLGSAVAAAIAHFTSIAQNIADAFEPDLESWEALPIARSTAVGALVS
jgi:hypothetical protein